MISKWIDNVAEIRNRGLRIGRLLELARGTFRMTNAFKSRCELKYKTSDLVLSGSSPEVLTDFLPAQTLIIGCDYRITVAIAGGTSFLIGDESDDDRFFAAQTTYTKGTKAAQATLAALPNAAAQDLSVAWTGTMSGGGTLRITIWYFEFTTSVE